MPTQSPNTSLLDAKNQSPSDHSPAALAVNDGRVTFLLRNLPPPSIIYVERNDLLIVEAGSQDTSEVVKIFVRLLLADGSIVEMQESILCSNGVASSNNKTLTLAEGYLLSFAVVATNATQRGQCFVKAFINRGVFNVFAPNAARVLFSNYTTRAAPLGWPEAPLVYSTDGPGRIVTLQPGAPGAGTDWTLVCPLNVRWRVKQLFGQLTTSVAVANRQVELRLANSIGGTLWEGSANQNIPASTLADVSASPNLPYNSLITTVIQIPLPEVPIIANNGQLKSNTINIQAADQWSNPLITVEEWVDMGGI